MAEMDRPLDAFHQHEALHTTWVLMETFGSYVAEHPYVTAHPDLERMAETAHRAMFDLYQAIGAKSLDTPTGPHP